MKNCYHFAKDFFNLATNTDSITRFATPVMLRNSLFLLSNVTLNNSYFSKDDYFRYSSKFKYG